MPRFSAPISILAGLAIIATIAAGCVGSGAAAAPATASGQSGGSAVAAAARPTVDLTITGGVGGGSYATDPNASLDLCTHAKDGSWRVMYAGGSPWVNVDLLIGPRAAEAGREGDLALEISVGSAYLWIDQPGFRGGDAPGRSSASVAIRSEGGATRFQVSATTPNRTPAGDGVSSKVTLTVVCPG
jgi:hypothetical protein